MNETFRKYLEEAIGSKNALVAFSAFEQPASVSIRLNPFKNVSGMEGRPVAWNRYGLILEQRPQFTLDPLFHGGAYYVQDTSSMFVGHVFRQVLSKLEKPSSRPLRVLDLCAAPGGKTTDLLSSLREVCGDSFLLVANEVMKARVGVLADNVALWGDPNVVVTSEDPKAFAKLSGYFDVVLADVPCSGEGMFRKDEEAQRQWSEDNVSLCASRQKRIVADVWPSLAENGVFIYSTCTFNRFENDDNVEWIAENMGAEVDTEDFSDGCPGVLKTRHGYSLVPGHVEGEGQYCGVLHKTSDVDWTGGKPGHAEKGTKGAPIVDGLDKLFRQKMVFALKGETVTAVPEIVSGDVSMLRKNLHVIAAGCAVGTLKGKILVPDADLALSTALNRDAFPCAEVDRQTALAFLHRDAVTLPGMEKGYVLICHCGLPLGFVKNLGNRCNSLHPQSRRIRMNIV